MQILGVGDACGSMADDGANGSDVESEPLPELGSVLNLDAVPVTMSPFGGTATARQNSQKRQRYSDDADEFLIGHAMGRAIACVKETRDQLRTSSDEQPASMLAEHHDFCVQVEKLTEGSIAKLPQVHHGARGQRVAGRWHHLVTSLPISDLRALFEPSKTTRTKATQSSSCPLCFFGQSPSLGQRKCSISWCQSCQGWGECHMRRTHVRRQNHFCHRPLRSK